MARLLGLQPPRETRRRALFGLPVRLFGRSLARLTGQGRSVLVARQEEQDWAGILEPALAWQMVPATG
jgi:hypothetical protein